MTIDCFNMTTAHHYGDALAAQFRLRQKVFIDRVSYNVPTWHGMEFDQFDTPATQYFVWRDADGVARGVARMAPTSLNYMLEEIWPDKITEVDLPKSEKIWEGTRFGVDNTLPTELRSRIVKELVCAYIEFAIANKIDGIIGMMPVGIIRAVFARNGWKAKLISPVWLEDGIEVQAGILPVSQDVLQLVRHRTKASDVLDLRGIELEHEFVHEAA